MEFFRLYFEIAFLQIRILYVFENIFMGADMNIKRNLFTVSVFFLTALFTACATGQNAWKIDVHNIEKDIVSSKKDGVIIFTVSDTNEASKKLLDEVFTEDFFSKAGKQFVFYNVNIVKDEALMSKKELEKNYILFSDYNVLEVPHICMFNKDGDVYCSELIPSEINNSNDLIKFLNARRPKGESVSNLRGKINRNEGIEKIKAIEEFFNSVYFVDSVKYVPFFEEGIKSDPENKSGLTGKFLLAKKQLVIDDLLLQKKYGEAIDEFKETLGTNILTPEEAQGVWCNIAYIAALSKKYPKTEILSFLENALKSAPSGSRAADIKQDIEYLKRLN